RAVELALTLTDWGEVIVAVNLCLEGLLQPFQRELHLTAARRERDMGTAMLGRHCWIDEERHLGWTDAFLRLVIDADPANRVTLQTWYDTHAPAARPPTPRRRPARNWPSAWPPPASRRRPTDEQPDGGVHQDEAALLGAELRRQGGHLPPGQLRRHPLLRLGPVGRPVPHE